MRFTDEELSVIKSAFATSDVDNDDMARALRKAMLQMPLDPIDQAMLRQIREQKDLVAVIKKTFLPKLDPNAPFHQILDLWMTVTQEFKDKSPEQALPYVKAREKLIEYLEQQLKFIEKETVGEIEFSSLCKITGKKPEKIFADLWMRSTLISHVETQLSQLVILGGKKGETVEQTLERLQKDSTR